MYMNKKILVMPDGNWLSHTSRPFEVAKELRELGHEVVFASDGQYMKLPQESGFQVFSITTINPERVLRCSRSGRTNWYDYDLIKACIEAELQLFDKVQPDLILSDFRLPLSTSCELAGIPLAVILNAAWTNYYSAKIKAPEHLKITRLLGRKVTTLFIPWIKNFILKIDSRPFNKFRQEQGLIPRKNIWDIWCGDLNLIVDIPEYGTTENLPEHFHYIGPIVWEPRIESPKWLETLDSCKPTIYFTMGSTGYARFFEQAIEIFGNTEYQCIMTTAGMVELFNIPDNFYVTDYAPGNDIMKKSDIVVCQGGNGTIYQAMSEGVPIIGIPTMHDQEFNLDRVEELGVGMHLSELKFKPCHLVKAVEKILSHDNYKDNALQYKNILANYNAPKKGAQLISNYLK